MHAARHRLSLLVALALALAGCDDGAGPDCGSDGEAPTLTTLPETPASLAPRADGTVQLQLNFSEAVTGVGPESFSGVDVQSVEGEGDDYVVTLGGLEPGDTATLTVAAAGIADLCGNALAADVDVEITVVRDQCARDATSPQVRSIPASPVALDAGTTSTTLTLVFNEAVEGVDGAVTVDGGASVDSVTLTDGVYEVALSGLEDGTTTVTVGGGVTDACGNALSPASFELVVPETDTTPPTVASTDPADGATDVNFRQPIEVVFSEAMDPSMGTSTVMAAAALDVDASWSADGTTLTLTPPTSGYGFEQAVTVTLSGYADTSGNALAADETLSFTTGADPCSGLPETVSVDAELVEADGAAGTVTLGFALDADFPLTESLLALTPTRGGSGALVAGSLMGGPRAYTVDASGVANGETYDLEITGAETADFCTTLLAGVVPVAIREPLPTTSGACPLPETLPNHYADPDACDERTNASFATAASTGFTLARIGDGFSVGGTYDSDSIGGSDNEYYTFGVVSDGTRATDLRVSIAYGCSFTGSGTRSSSAAPVIDLLDGSGAEIASFDADDDYASIDGSGNFGVGLGEVSVVLPPGSSTLGLRVDDDAGTSWCMDYVIYVEMVDDSRPAGCASTPRSVQIDGTPQNAFLASAGAPVTVALSLSGDFPLDESAITVTPTSGGSGALVPGSLRGSGSAYLVDVAGAADGETYDVSVSPRSGVCASLRAGFVPVTVTTDLVGGSACPLPGPLTTSFVAPDACGAGPTNGTLATSAATGATLMGVGDAFSIGGIYDSDTSPDLDFFSFQLVESGTTATDLRVVFTYGCSFTGTGSRSSTNEPEIELLDDAGTVLGTFDGADSYGDVDGSGRYGFGASSIRVLGPAGTNTYHLRIDDVSGSDWCMDYDLRVEVTDDTFPAECVGAGPTAALDASSTEGQISGGVATVVIPLDDRFVLAETDLTLTPTSGGGGSIVPGSLRGSGDTYTIDLTGVALGETYDLDLAGRTDGCGTALTGGTLTVSLTDLPVGGMCPLPAPLAAHTADPDACGARTNGDESTAIATGVTLSSAGDRFSVGGIYDSDNAGASSDNEFYAFEIVGDGVTDYVVELRAAYGCSFTGSGTPGGWAPDVEILDSTGATIGSAVTGDDDYDDVDGSGFYGFGRGTVTIPAADNPAGTNTFYLWLDDGVGTGWCMDFQLYVTLVSP